MGMRRCLFFTLLLLCTVLSGGALAEQTARFSILQAVQDGSDLLVYAEVLDRDMLPVPGLAEGSLQATYGADRMRVLSFEPAGPSGEGMAVLFLVDISKSLREKEFSGIREALSNWVNGMGEEDRASVIAFGEDVHVLADFDQGRDKAVEAVSALAPTDSLTQLYRAIMQGLEIGQRVDERLPQRRVVVLVSDGMDDTHGGATREEVLRALEKRGIPLWAVGFHSGKLTDSKKAGLSSLGELARISGGDAFLVSGSGGFAEAFESLKRRLDGAYVARLDCSELSGTGEARRLQLVLADGERAFTDGMDVRFMVPLARAEAEEASPKNEAEVTDDFAGKEEPASGTASGKKGFPLVPMAGGLAALGAGALFLFSRSRKIQGEFSEPASGQEPLLRDDPVQQNRVDAGKPDSVSIAAGIPVRLEVVRGPGKGRVFELNVDGPLSVGRSRKNNHLVLEGDLGVSGRHLEFFTDQGGLFVRDLRSTNGTFINGVRISSSHRLEEGDRLLLGGTELRVLIAL